MAELLFALWFFLPAGAANMVPVIIAQLPGLRRLNAPMDFGATLGGQRILGEHKTWRGLVSAVVVATLVLILQQYLVRRYGWFVSQAAGADYTSLSALALGPVLAIGALGGDAVESFIKRRRGFSPGRAWLPYDIVDHIIGAALVTLPVIMFAWWVYVMVFAIWFCANFGISYLGYCLHLKARPM